MLGKNRKKGFTLVELVIVIAVIAILAAVLIPTFANLIQKSKLSSDQVAVNGMNIVLTADEAINGKPDLSDGKNAYITMRNILSENGYAGGALAPVADHHKFYWKSTINRVILVDIEGVDGAHTVFPAGDEYAYDSNICYDLANLPTASLQPLSDVEGKSLVVIPDMLTLDTGVSFKADENYNMGTDESEYKNYNVDFLLEFNRSFDASHVQNGEALGANSVGFSLLGSYQAYNSGQWVPLPVFKYDGTPIRVMRLLNDAMGWQEDAPWAYSFIAGIVKEFDCGIKAVYQDDFTMGQFDTFNYDNQMLSESDKAFLNGLEVTIKLVMYETEETAPGSDTYREVQGAVPEVIRVYKCIYRVDGDSLTVINK